MTTGRINQVSKLQQELCSFIRINNQVWCGAFTWTATILAWIAFTQLGAMEITQTSTHHKRVPNFAACPGIRCIMRQIIATAGSDIEHDSTNVHTYCIVLHLLFASREHRASCTQLANRSKCWARIAAVTFIIYCIVLHLLLVSCRRAHRTLHTVLTDRKQVVMLSTYCNFNVYCILNRTTVTISFMSESTGHNTRGHMKQVAMLSTAFTISCMS